MDLLHRLEKLHKEWIKPGHRTGRNTHNVSVTISLKPEEWPEVGEWAWTNRNNYTALSCLPYDNGSYVQAPFETITEEQFNEAVTKLHEIDLSKVIEQQDNTDQKGELACAGGACEII
jgi:ribonucleoside-diphosphate reductase alpha chain